MTPGLRTEAENRQLSVTLTFRYILFDLTCLTICPKALCSRSHLTSSQTTPEWSPHCAEAVLRLKGRGSVRRTKRFHRRIWVGLQEWTCSSLLHHRLSLRMEATLAVLPWKDTQGLSSNCRAFKHSLSKHWKLVHLMCWGFYWRSFQRSATPFRPRRVHEAKIGIPRSSIMPSHLLIAL